MGTFLSQWLREIDVRPKTLQGYESMAILGHSTITLTANTYSHLTDAGKRQAVDRLSELLG